MAGNSFDPWKPIVEDVDVPLDEVAAWTAFYTE